MKADGSARKARTKQRAAVRQARPGYIPESSLGHPRAILAFGVRFAVAIKVQEGEVQKDTFRRAEAVVVDDTPARNRDLASWREAMRRVRRA